MIETSLQKDPNFKQLYETDPAFKDLSNEHVKLKQEVSEIRKAKYLSQEMTVKIKTLKKKKLEIKDKMESILAKHRM